MRAPASPVLSASQLATLREHGEERSAAVGDILFRVGDKRYPFIAIVEGEAAILDAAGREIVRHGTSNFLGEINLMSGQTVYLTAVVTEPMRYIAVDRDQLRALLFEDAPLSDLLLSSFTARREALQRQEGVGIEVVGPRSSESTRRMVEYMQRNRLPYTWRDSSSDLAAAALIAPLDVGELPLVCLPGGADLRNPSSGEVSRAIGIGLELAPREEVDLVVIGGGPAGLGAAVYGRRGPRGVSRITLVFPRGSAAQNSQAVRSRRRESSVRVPQRRIVRSRLSREQIAMSCAWKATTRSLRGRLCWPLAPTIAVSQLQSSINTRV